ncbi:MAG: ketoacyl-ACP synthase III [Labilithrix sp.]|nr:ketoacyl-ACP synthase III [Labilithrix sp.]
MGFEVIGTGMYVPGEPVTNTQLTRVMDTSDEWIHQRSGIRQRHFAAEGQGVSDMAFEATKRALEAARIGPKDIDYILFATMTPDYVFPGSGAVLGGKLGINVPALDIRQQCGAMLYGLQLIDGLIKSGVAKTILFIGAEAHAGFMPWDDWDILEGKTDRKQTPEQRERANKHRAVAVLFGDGAGAMVFRATDRDAGLIAAKVHSDGTYVDELLIPGCGFKTRPYCQPRLYEEMLYVPYMNGKEVFKFAVTTLPKCARQLCEESKTPIEKIDWFLAHQANARINDYVREQLDVPVEKMPMNIDRYGNTSAGTLPILIDECTRDGKLKKGDLTMMFALGAGMHWGCALVRW